MNEFDLLVHRWCERYSWTRKSRHGKNRGGRRERKQKWLQVRHLSKKLNIQLG